MIENINNVSLERLFHEVTKLNHYKKMEKLEKLGLYRGQPPILFALYEKDGRTQREIAEFMRIQASTATKMIQRMEKSGFIMRKSDETDKRKMRVFLTEQGKNIKPRLKKVIKEVEEKTFENISIEEKIILKRIFLQMYNNIKD